jgi:hypothetical protein
MSREADTVSVFSGCWTGRIWSGCRAGVSLSCYCYEEIYSCDDAPARQAVRASVDACMTMVALLLPTSSILVMLVSLSGLSRPSPSCRDGVLRRRRCPCYASPTVVCCQTSEKRGQSCRHAHATDLSLPDTWPYDLLRLILVSPQPCVNCLQPHHVCVPTPDRRLTPATSQTPGDRRRRRRRRHA